MPRSTRASKAHAAALVALATLLVAGRASGQPRARVRPAEGPIVVDGSLDEATWAAAEPFGDFVERSPKLRADPPVETTVYALVTADALYVGIRLQDDEAPVGRTQRRDDGAIFRDDAISIKLDPTRDGRTTYGFVLNPASARLDYRGINETDFRTEYDSVWLGASERTADGWTAEFKIPWSSLGIDPTSPPEEVGLNFSRDHARRTATYDWALMTPPLSPIAASRYGRLGGLEVLAELSEAAGGSDSSTLQLIPYGVTGYRRGPDPDDLDRTRESLFNAGVDAKARIGRVRAHATINTDFAQVDLDNQVVNLTRFGLFLPEKRDFFLEDLEVFSFGRPQEGQMLYTRRIGLGRGTANLQPIPILAGAKVVGRPADALRLGVLQVTTQPLDGTPWTSHGVARTLVELGGGSNVGLMATHRQSLEAIDDRNVTVGVDGAWRARDTNLVAEAFSMGSVTGAEAPDPAGATGGDGRGAFAGRFAPGGGASVTLREQFIRPRLSYTGYHPELRGDLGFFQRVGIHQGEASIELEPRIDRGGVNRVNSGVAGVVIGSWEGDEVLEYRGNFFSQVRSSAGYVVGTEVTRRFERVQQPFEVGRTTSIPAGDYWMWVASLYANTPSTYAISGSLTLTGRDYYGGRLLEAAGSTSWAPSSLLRFDVGATYDRVDFPVPTLADFNSFVLNARTSFGFTPALGLRIFTGYNLLGDVLQLQSRLRWSFTPSADMFVVVQTDLDDDAWTPRFSTVVLKATFRWPGS